MGRRLPPLNAVRAFEAAARHLSLARAAEELCVTPAALGQQIQALEQYLGRRLLERRGRGTVALTDAGEMCLPALKLALDSMADAFARLERTDDSTVVTVLVPAALSSKWLVPRLHRFHSRHPEIDVRVWSTARDREHDAHDHDLAITTSGVPAPGLHVERLMQEVIVPVCSPRLLTGQRPLRTPWDLSQHTLLHDDSLVGPTDGAAPAYPNWSRWLEAAGVTSIDTSHGPHFQLSNVVIEAALEGHGVALGRSCLVIDDLHAGRLVRPFDVPYLHRYGYFLACEPTALERRATSLLRSWLLEEGSATDQTALPATAGQVAAAQARPRGVES